MGCGCNKNKGTRMDTSPQPTHPALKQLQEASASQNNRTSQAVRQDAPRSDSYSLGFACRKCLFKHLSKAAVELSEYIEDDSRYAEFSLCVGDLSCAEDHARALNDAVLADTIKGVRSSVTDSPSIHQCSRIRDLAAVQAKELLDSRSTPTTLLEARSRIRSPEPPTKKEDPPDDSNG